jgi:CheY-like chemotaxis protein
MNANNSDCRSSPISKIDPGGLSNVLINLVINARDAMPDGGHLTIHWGRCSFEKTAHGLPPGEYILISVCDTGHGIAPEHIDRIFEPFFTTKDRGKGTGLGLAMVFGFARQSGGTITVHSTIGDGTCFTLYMPAATNGVVAEPEYAAEAMRELPTGNERILLVDDETGLLEVAEQWLTSLGYAVTVTALPEIALRLLTIETFDLLVTDVVMPGPMDGLALAAKSNSIRPGMPVLLASAFAKGLDSDKPPPWPLLNKPYSKIELAQQIRHMIDHASGTTPA